MRTNYSNIKVTFKKSYIKIFSLSIVCSGLINLKCMNLTHSVHSRLSNDSFIRLTYFNKNSLHHMIHGEPHSPCDIFGFICLNHISNISNFILHIHNQFIVSQQLLYYIFFAFSMEDLLLLRCSVTEQLFAI